MLTLLGFAIFGGAFGLASLALAVTIVPRFGRIIEALHGTPHEFVPRELPATGERGATVRRRAATSRAPDRAQLCVIA